MSRNDLTFSFIIPTFNRASVLAESIKSAMDWLGNTSDGEIVVVDDASSDGTQEFLNDRFGPEIHAGLVKVLRREKNGGVASARNSAIREAKGKWLLLLDSDDLMIADAHQEMRQAFAEFSEAPAILFRCENIEGGELIGAPQSAPSLLPLAEYLNRWSYGECIPAIRKNAFERFAFEETLNGWEGLTYARMMRALGPFVVSPIVARRYRSVGADRLSSPQGRRRRSWSLARGHWILMQEFWRVFTYRKLFGQIAKVGFYSLLAVASSIGLVGSRKQ